MRPRVNRVLLEELAAEQGIDPGAVLDVLPQKFHPDYVARGWDRAHLYTRVEGEQTQWEGFLRPVVPDLPSFDDALAVVQRALRFLPK